jgi:hypothetical protein
MHPLHHKIKLVWALDLELDGPAYFWPRGEYIQNVLHVIQQEWDDKLNAGAITNHSHSLSDDCKGNPRLLWRSHNHTG